MVSHISSYSIIVYTKDFQPAVKHLLNMKGKAILPESGGDTRLWLVMMIMFM